MSLERGLSVFLITLNEADNLPRCLASLPKGAEIVVVDSSSADDTKSIARAFGAKVFDRDFDNYGSQKNFALAQTTREWALSIDADEELSPELCRAIESIVRDSPSEAVGYYLKRRLRFMGRLMSFGKTIDYPLRLFRRGQGRFVGEIHEKVRCEGPVIKLRGGYMSHLSYKNLADYFDRFNRYTTRIANSHRSAQKRVFFPLHLARPWLEFFNRYVIRLGFLDGYPGYVYALNSSLYAFIKYSKLIEEARYIRSEGKQDCHMAP